MQSRDKHRSPERLARVSAALADLEDCWNQFQNASLDERPPHLEALHRIGTELISATQEDRYVRERLEKLAKTCDALGRRRKPRGFDEACYFVEGAVDIKLIRAELLYRRMISSAL